MTIQPVSNPEGKAAELLGAVKKAMGSTPNIFTTFANAPAALEGYLNFNGALSSGVLDQKLREQIALTVAGLNGCDYCASAHTFLGKNAGLSETELTANLNGQSDDVKTQVVLNFATTIVESRGHPTSADIELVNSAGFSNEEIIEILAHVALNTFTNYFNESFGVEVDFPKISTQATRKTF